MRYCTHCGKPVNNQAKFCAACGTPTESAPTTAPSAAQRPTAPPSVMPGNAAATQDTAATKQKKILYVAIAIVAAVILIFAGLLIHNHGVTSSKDTASEVQENAETSQGASDQDDDTDQFDEQVSSAKDEDDTESTVTSNPSKKAKDKPSPKPTRQRDDGSKEASKIRNTLQSGDFSVIAGRYCTNGGNCLTIDDVGRIQAEHDKKSLTLEERDTTLHVTNEERYQIDPQVKDKLIMLSGPDEDYRCFSTAGKIDLQGADCKHASEHYADRMFLPVWMLYFPKGVELNDSGVTNSDDAYELPSDFEPANPSRPFIQWVVDPSSTPLADGLVYYLVD